MNILFNCMQQEKKSIYNFLSYPYVIFSLLKVNIDKDKVHYITRIYGLQM